MAKSRSSSKNLGLTQKFARYLANQRAKRKWSLRELASRSGISLTRLWNYEQGNHSPNLTALAKMARAFKMPLSRFIKPLE
jgi:transcriptional regulator with XRE-family HTH domain